MKIQFTLGNTVFTLELPAWAVLLQIVLAVLKLGGAIAWTWPVVFIPAFLILGVWTILFLIVFLLAVLR